MPDLVTIRMESCSTNPQRYYHLTPVEETRVLVIGLGQIGFHNAQYMTAKGLHVEGYDKSSEAVERAKSHGVIHSAASDFCGYDYYIVSVSTHEADNMFTPDLDGIHEVVSRIAAEGRPGALVSIESTVTMGTTKALHDFLEHRMHLVHAPHRFYVNEKEIHGVKQQRVLGGCGACCLERGQHFYRELLDIPIVRLRSPELAELTKIVENSHRYIEIAFAEELKIFCDRAGISFKELRDAVNTKWNVCLLEARDGIGGHCLPKDCQMFLDKEKTWVKNSLVKTAKLVDYEYRMHLRDTISQHVISSSVSELRELRQTQVARESGSNE